MSKSEELKCELSDILNKVADQLNLKHYEIELDIESDKGDGFLGEFFLGNVIDKDANTKYYIAIKKAAPSDARIRKMMDLNTVYRVENLFYSVIFPALDKFQRDAGVKDPFTVTKYYLGTNEEFHEAVVMENIRELGFTLHDKRIPLNEEQIRRIFKEYGKFHALSLAFKHQYKEEFEKFAAELPPFFSFITHQHHSVEHNVALTSEVLKLLDSEKHADLIKKFEPYTKNGDLFQKAFTYDGNYGTILHGDCWSNNMMFKYDENGKIESLRILDFQLCGVGSPASDLSYFFYAGASKKDYYKLDEYLDIYYESFSTFAKELNSDPNKLYPREELTREWKKYGIGGIMMSFAINSIKSIKKEDVGDIATGTGDSGSNNFNMSNSASVDALEHGYDYGIV